MGIKMPINMKVIIIKAFNKMTTIFNMNKITFNKKITSLVRKCYNRVKTMTISKINEIQ